ncbi:hypothetical protein EOA30_35280, partial [Mesorhizobium sp. M8A.F.Ca.ET.059.01.1.1]
PHLPAGILSPYSDGERGAVVADFASRQRCWRGADVAASPLLPATIREVPGRAMRAAPTPTIDLKRSLQAVRPCTRPIAAGRYPDDL